MKESDKAITIICAQKENARKKSGTEKTNEMRTRKKRK